VGSKFQIAPGCIPRKLLFQQAPARFTQPGPAYRGRKQVGNRFREPGPGFGQKEMLAGARPQALGAQCRGNHRRARRQASGFGHCGRDLARNFAGLDYRGENAAIETDLGGEKVKS